MSARRIGYVTWFYPHLTETFVWREVLGLRRRGVDVATFAAWPPNREQLTPALRELAEETRYAFPLPWLGFVASHLSWLLRRPRRYLGTLGLVATRRYARFSHRLLAIVHFAMAVDLATSMRRQGIEHLHAHFAINAATVAFVAARLLDVPFSLTVHNLVFTQQLMLEEKLRAARFVVAISEFTKAWLIEFAGAELADRVHVVHCGVSPDEFAPSPPREVDVPEVLFVAQLAERKGAPVLVEACAELARRGVRFHCTIIGDGPQRAEVEARVRAHGLEAHVELAGAQPQERVAERLDRADVFVLPCVVAADGDMDGVPVSLMEAMAKGIPVVSTTVSGIPELVEDGVSGLLVAPNDHVGLADAMQRLLEQPDLRSALGAAGRDAVRRGFDIDVTTAELAALFARH